ncbi:NUDIX domain-containing protein [Atopostipes suicloacalis DSM 15692]|uniref:NUDIX domain-containing protein n=1 Tax=Atopostipes suicloacalis DSM 15692 TaxID=1121025 RepID=A0A1M4V5U4_9LACT|nr:CoA pyrophosphatase [Atopostipes suicloacalis]SHE64272.1 NUDIX domain-containing protein [Atopostipes suicloacalis DSM 15692]
MLSKIRSAIQSYDPKIYGDVRKSAVLLPLIKRKGEWHILYEVRSQAVSQAGDSSFPGGGVEAGETFEEAAIRETMEELSLREKNIKIIGEIDYIVNQRMVIYCFVGELVNVEFEDIEPNLEVEKIYTVPIQYLLNKGPSYFEVEFDPVISEQFLNEQKEANHSFQLRGLKERIPYYEIQNHRLWGYTANLTDRFIQIIKN